MFSRSLQSKPWSGSLDLVIGKGTTKDASTAEDMDRTRVNTHGADKRVRWTLHNGQAPMVGSVMVRGQYVCSARDGMISRHNVIDAPWWLVFGSAVIDA